MKNTKVLPHKIQLINFFKFIRTKGSVIFVFFVIYFYVASKFISTNYAPGY